MTLAILSSINLIHYKMYNSDRDDEELMKSPLTPGISVIAPAYNEEKTIVVNVKSLLTLEYPLFEVIIVNDGSKDKTLAILIEEFELIEVDFLYIEKIKTKPFKRIFKSTNPKYAILTIVDKENGGTKADASNAGVNASVFPYFLCTDVDCVLNRKTLLKMIKPFLSSQKNVLGVGSALRMLNGCEVREGVITRVKPPNRIIPLFQELEYIRSYLLGKMGWSFINSVPNISGGLGLFNKDIAIKSGGYDGKSHAEDMDLTTKMARYMMNNKLDYKLVYIPVSCCWTEGPDTLKVLGRQRTRWSSGLAQIFSVYRNILFNKKYKRLGLIAFPYIFVFEFLAPIIETIGLFFTFYIIIFEKINWNTALILLLYSYTFAMFVTILVIIQDHIVFKHYQKVSEVLKVILAGFLEPFIYHPLILFFAIKGYFNFYLGRELQWGTMTRRGVNTN
jgi:cellulose synthase/poly-beta-1,6-N-acetylglucosamine synthase-like glycosyltransferase